jgi:hypothetical protein
MSSSIDETKLGTIILKTAVNLTKHEAKPTIKGL